MDRRNFITTIAIGATGLAAVAKAEQISDVEIVKEYFHVELALREGECSDMLTGLTKGKAEKYARKNNKRIHYAGFNQNNCLTDGSIYHFEGRKRVYDKGPFKLKSCHQGKNRGDLR